jgi:hypothetical protein
MHEMIVFIHTMLVVTSMSSSPLRKTDIQKKCPYKPPPRGMSFEEDRYPEGMSI